MANEKRLVRSRTDKMVGGVCGGIGEYFNIDPTLVRVVFAILVLIGVGSPLLLYLLLWIIMPAADSPRAMLSDAGGNGTDVSSVPVATAGAEDAPLTSQVQNQPAGDPSTQG